jgi:dienelactone hydrolase
MRSTMMLALVALLAACSGQADSAPDAGALDGAADASAPGNLPELDVGVLATTLESSKVVSSSGGVTVLDVVYRSQGLAIRGRICRPTADGKYPTLLLDHGGVDGFGQADFDACVSSAQNGWVAALSAYRGEGGSEGAIEFCKGEVVDVRNLLEILRHAPYVDPARVGAMGWSHGGCITLRLAQLGAPLAAIVNFFGPTDMAAQYSFMAAATTTTTNPTTKAQYDRLLSLLTNAAGGPPSKAPLEYATRSVVARPHALASFAGSVLTIAGVDDEIVPAAQSCDLHAKLGTTENYHVQSNGTLIGTSPNGCSGLSGWKTALPDAKWPAARYLILYDGMGHETSSNAGKAAFAAAVAFVAAKIP